MASAGKAKSILIIVENLPSPFDRRVWQEATTLKNAGYIVSIICPTGKGFEKKFEMIDDIRIYRHNLPLEAGAAAGYLLEYSAAIFWQFALSFKVLFKDGFDVIHACNPPDLIFIVGGFFKFFFGKKFVFDHHDINPELYLAKFHRKDFFYSLMLLLERLTFRCADRSIATNESYKKIAIERGKIAPELVTVVRSGPSLERMYLCADCTLTCDPSYVETLKKGRKHLLGYVGVIGKQEGIDYLLKSIHYLVYTKQYTDFVTVIVGGGTELATLKAMAKELKIEDYITFAGRLPDKELLCILNQADVCVNPDVANEMNDKSTMNKILEYMALAKPIVQFDLAEGRFSAQAASLYARRNDYTDMADKIHGLFLDPAKRAEMGAIGRKRVLTELEWNYEAPKLLQVYESLWS